ncbi:SIMPL domain-containing protein [bacterium]|nr:SIMPL domain-containing protein [bacterium]
MQSRKQKALRTTFALLAVASLANAAQEEKTGRQTYYGTGRVEAAPEWAEVNFSFNVGCRDSATDVHKAITAVSSPIWQTIQAKITTQSETDQTSWGDVSGVNGQDDSYLEVKYNQQGQRVGTAVRKSLCGNKVLPLETKPGKIYSGSQSFRVRVGADKMDWLEALVKKVDSLPKGTKVSDVSVGHTKIAYELTQASRRQAEVDVQKQARERALGTGSLFESDSKNLKFASAHFLGQRVDQAPDYGGYPGQPVKRGGANKVTMTLPFVYTVYAEGADRIDPNNPQGFKGLESEYRISGQATADADYAQVTVNLQANCQETETAAQSAYDAAAADVKSDLDAVLKGKPASETDRLVYNAANVSKYFPYTEVSWDADGKVSEYINTCTGVREDAPKSGGRAQLKAYWTASNSFTLSTSDFTAAIDLVESLRGEYLTGSNDTKAIQVYTSDAIGAVTPATKFRLQREAREYATSCVLAPAGSLANDANTLSFRCAHLKNIRVEYEAPVSKGLEMGRGGNAAGARARSAAPVPESAMDVAPGAAPGGGLTVDEITRDGETRPRKVVEGSYAFDFQFLSQDYVPTLKTAQP